MLAATRAEARLGAFTRFGTVALALGAAALLAIRLDAPAFFDNEARYAEVAREMLLRRDWLSPHLDFTLYLNKPPLAFWLTALVFQLGGPSEWARLVSVVAGAVAVLATARLGALLYGEAAGLVGALALASIVGFALEIQYMLAPDFRYNQTKGSFPTVRFFGYPSPTRRYSLVAGKSTTRDEDYELHWVYGVGVRGVVRPQIVGFVDVGRGSEGTAIFTGVDYPF